MIKKIILAVLAVVLVLAGLAGIKAAQIGTLIAFGKSFVPPPETVSTTVAKEEKWQETIPAVGSISAVQGVRLMAEVPGTVEEIKFESGAMVAKGDLLVRFDVSTEEAQLRALEAQVEWAQTNLARYKSLRAENTVSQSEYDQADTDLKQKQANADAVRASIAKKIIRAPFAGQLGIREINVGEYLEAGKPIVSLQSLAPVYADFSLPQQELARLKTGLGVRVTTDTYPNKQFLGTLTAINPDLDTATRSVRLQGTCANAEQLLRPGMFARIEVLLPDEHPVLAIPATSVLSAPYGDSVYVVQESTNAAGGLIVRQQFIRVGRTRGDFVAVETGLKPGDRVVTSGIFKLRNGMNVVENNNLSPNSEKKPNPSDS
ncbi:MAG TPA: efflux RND transporter periplasmic adaptor subunit [Verrucomicrobiae bacterium]|nr:efflux RND transporter periplasmic adaptor subunit [Verrucomicrobiae bacterium]